MNKEIFTLSSEVTAELKIKHSTFISRIKRIQNTQEAKEYISQISKIEKNANHNCWAYRINDNIYHYSDAGEPSGTAGKPIFNTLLKYNLYQVVCVVTRYFGGVKLGIRGLIDAYSQVTQKALENAKIIPIVEMKTWKIALPYTFLETFKHKCRTFHVEIDKTDYSDKVFLECKAEKKYWQNFDNYLYEMIMQKKIELIEK